MARDYPVIDIGLRFVCSPCLDDVLGRAITAIQADRMSIEHAGYTPFANAETTPSDDRWILCSLPIATMRADHHWPLEAALRADRHCHVEPRDFHRAFDSNGDYLLCVRGWRQNLV